MHTTVGTRLCNGQHSLEACWKVIVASVQVNETLPSSVERMHAHHHTRWWPAVKHTSRHVDKTSLFRSCNPSLERDNLHKVTVSKAFALNFLQNRADRAHHAQANLMEGPAFPV